MPRLGLPLLAAVAATVALLALAPRPALAISSLSVDTAADNNVSDTVLSLREAILLMNGGTGASGLNRALDAGETDNVAGSPGAGSVDTTTFDATVFTGSPLVSITVTTALPSLLGGSDVIDGTGRGVIVRGSLEPSGFPCIALDSNSNTVTGLELTDCASGIAIVSSRTSNIVGPGIIAYDNNQGIAIVGNANTVKGNFVGTTADGTAVHPDGGNIVDGILIAGDTNTIGGSIAADRNVISGNSSGIRIQTGGNGNIVKGNYIGTDVTGALDKGNNGNGIVIADDGNFVGGTGAGDGNVISGNNLIGVTIAGGADSNTVQGNIIGLDATGTIAIGNTLEGVQISGSTLNVVGGTDTGARNIVSGNLQNGVSISGVGTSGNTVQGNYLGTDVTGTLDRGNGANGVSLGGSSSNTIGGTAAGAGNVISGNVRGVQITGSSNFIEGNLIGTNAAGTSAIGNSFQGVLLSGASSNTIGGIVPGSGNVISGNNSVGIEAVSSTGNQIQGNLIGTDVDGSADLGNSGAGVLLNGASNTIGGSTAAHRNVISGNNSAGVVLSGAAATGNTVAGNYIGVQADGATALGNTSHGVFVTTSASTNTIGGATAAVGNTIASNGADGVYVFSGTGNSVRFNSIHSNTGLGIDIGGDGITPNDVAPDADAGANNLQNFPLLASAGFGATSTHVSGTLNSAASTTFSLLFFHNSACDPSGNGEGQVFLGSADAATDAGGNATFGAVLAVGAPGGSFVTATATDPAGNTSEFSACIQVLDDADDDNDGYTDDAEAGTPLCSGSVNDDGAPVNDDALVNDGCPAVGPAEGVCNDAIDNDADGRVNDGCVQSGALSEAQFKIGTGAQDPCGSNGWPSETFSTAPSANELTIQDVTAFIGPTRRIDTSPGHPNFLARLDLLPGKGAFAQWINIQDLTALFGGPTAFPPMFGGARAFDKTCPWPP